MTIGLLQRMFLGDEIKEPGKNIPRALLLSIVAVACLYVVMNISILGVVPWREMVQSGASTASSTWFPPSCSAPTGSERPEWCRPYYVDGVCLGVFAHARVFAGALRGGGGWKLFSGVRPGASGAQVSVRFIAGAGGGGGAVLLSEAGGF